MSLKAVFVDVGNTLVRESPSRYEIYAATARSRGASIDGPQMRALMHTAHHELPRVVDGAFRYSDAWFLTYIERVFRLRLGLDAELLPGIQSELFERFSSPATFNLFDGSLALFERLRGLGLKVGIISNWSARLPGLLEALGIARRVDFVMCSAIERLEKPDPELFERALERAGVRPDEALHAGDDLEKDLFAAQRVGLRALLVDHERVNAKLSVPRVESLDELSEIVARLCA